MAIPDKFFTGYYLKGYSVFTCIQRLSRTSLKFSKMDLFENKGHNVFFALWFGNYVIFLWWVFIVSSSTSHWGCQRNQFCQGCRRWLLGALVASGALSWRENCCELVLDGWLSWGYMFCIWICSGFCLWPNMVVIWGFDSEGFPPNFASDRGGRFLCEQDWRGTFSFCMWGKNNPDNFSFLPVVRDLQWVYGFIFNFQNRLQMLLTLTLWMLYEYFFYFKEMIVIVLVK